VNETRALGLSGRGDGRPARAAALAAGDEEGGVSNFSRRPAQLTARYFRRAWSVLLGARMAGASVGRASSSPLIVLGGSSQRSVLLVMLAWPLLPRLRGFPGPRLRGRPDAQPIAVPRNLSCEIASALRCSGGGLVWAPLRSVASAHPDLGRERGGGGFAAAWGRAARARRWRFDTRDRDTRARGCRMAVDRSDGAGAARRCVHV
jgi:hypothetical protein